MLSIDLSSLTSTYNSLRANAGKNTNLELEAKFGWFDKNGFRSNVLFDQYDRLLNYLTARLGKVPIEESTVYANRDIRKIVTADNRVMFQRKTRITDKDFTEYDIRVSLSKEEDLSDIGNFSHTSIRERSRRQFKYSDYVIIDMTHVIMRDTSAIVRYEVEIEYTGNDANEFRNIIEIIFKILKDTENVYTNTIKNTLIRDISKIMGTDGIRKESLVEARNIKKNDLVYGGLVGNKDTSYIVTYKADGNRKMLIFHKTGIWLVYPNFEYNLVLLSTSNNAPLFNKLNGTILDGELVANNKIKFRYLAFDTLSYVGYIDIQNKPYTERYEIVKTLSGIFRNDILTIDLKEWKELLTVQDYFREIPKFLDDRLYLDYKEDGLMFIPNNAVYNPKSHFYPLRDRVLTRYPDTCKWKPSDDMTIDFSIKWVMRDSGKILELCVFDKDAIVPFKGTDIAPITYDMIDYNNEMTKNLESGTIVEYEWNKGTKKLEPRKIRYEKSGPNRKEIAEQNWMDVINPITEEDLKGESLDMVYTHFNRLKRKLYSNIPKGSTILDIGSGRGGDISKWAAIDAKVLAVEPNEENRKELNSRLNRSPMLSNVKVIATGGEDTVKIIEELKVFIKNKVDAITLMLSMSFFWQSNAYLDSLVNTIVNAIKPGGKIYFLTINGDTVEQLFEPAFANIKKTDYSIGPCAMHLYPPSSHPYGRKLDFYLPDTIVGQQLEYVTHIQDLTLRLEKYGFKLDNIARADNEKLLSDMNQLFASMYSYGSYTNVDSSLLLDVKIEDIKIPTIKNTIIDLPKSISPPASPRVMTPDKIPTSPTTLKIIPVISKPVSPEIKPIINPIVPAVTEIKPIINPIMPEIKPLMPFKAVFPNIPKDYLPGLSVTFLDKNGIVNGPAINDDTYAPLKCTWAEKLVRIATLGEGNCFIHAVLKAFYKKYQENNNAKYRIEMATKIRRDLALILSYENTKYPSFTYWETVANGRFPVLLMQQLSDESLVRDLGLDFSSNGLMYFLNSYQFLGDEVYAFIAEIFGINVYILRATKDDLFPHLTTKTLGDKKKSAVIVGNTQHYEVLAIDKPEGFQTLFDADDDFIRILDSRFDIAPKEDFDPYVNYIVNLGDILPNLTLDKLNMFDDNDPFKKRVRQILQQK